MQDRRAVLVVLLTVLIALSSIAAAFAFVYSDGSEDDNFEIFGPRIDKLIVRKYASLDAEMAALQNGEIDITDSPPPKTWIDTFATDPNIRLASYGGDNVYYTINFNHNNNTYLGNPPDPAFPNPFFPNPISEVALRQACAHLINRTALVAGPGQGLYEPVYTPMPAYMNFWKHPEINLGGTLENLTYPQNFARAAEILEQGGFPMGVDDWRYWDMNRNGIKDSGEDFTLKIYARSDALRAGATEMLEAGLADPLIRIHNLIYYPPQWMYKGPYVMKNYHIIMSGWIYVGPEPDYLWDLYHWDNYYHDGNSNCPNCGSVSIDDPIMQEQLENIEFGLDDASVFSACLAFQERFAATASEIPLASTSAPKAYSKWYTGGNDGTAVDPDDGENKYRGHSWENIVNERGMGENSWFTTLSAYPQGNPFGDGHLTMRYGWKDTLQPERLNPLSSDWFWENEVIGRVFDTLGCWDPMTNGPFKIPRLVENWTIGVWTDPSDGLEKSKVTLKIRPGVFWSDGVPFTIEDLVYNLVDLPRELSVKIPPPWWTPYVENVAACYRLDEYSTDVLLKHKVSPASASKEILLWDVFYNAKGTPWIIPKHLWQPFIATHEETDITGDLSVTHPEMLVGTGPFVFVENTPSTLTLVRNPFYYQTANIAALRYERSSVGRSVESEGITITALPPSVQLRPFKIQSSWVFPASVRIAVPVTNLDVDDSCTIHEKVELLSHNGSIQTLLDVDKNLAPLQADVDSFDVFNLENGQHTVRVTVEVTGGTLYDYVTTNLPPELWQSMLGPRTVTESFWVTVLADIDESGTVDILDIVMIAANFGKSIGETGFKSEGDLNMDGTVDIFDIVLLASNFGWHY